MNKTSLYSIYDKKSKQYGPIFEAQNDPTAKRMTTISISNINKNIIIDLELQKIAEWDKEKGTIKETKETILDNKQLIEQLGKEIPEIKKLEEIEKKYLEKKQQENNIKEIK